MTNFTVYDVDDTKKLVQLDTGVIVYIRDLTVFLVSRESSRESVHTFKVYADMVGKIGIPYWCYGFINDIRDNKVTSIRTVFNSALKFDTGMKYNVTTLHYTTDRKSREFHFQKIASPYLINLVVKEPVITPSTSAPELALAILPTEVPLSSRYPYLDQFAADYPEFYARIPKHIFTDAGEKFWPIVSKWLLTVLINEPEEILEHLINYKGFPWDLEDCDCKELYRVLLYQYVLPHIVEKFSDRDWNRLSYATFLHPKFLTIYRDKPWELAHVLHNWINVWMDEDADLTAMLEEYRTDSRLDWATFTRLVDPHVVIEYYTFPWVFVDTNVITAATTTTRCARSTGTNCKATGQLHDAKLKNVVIELKEQLAAALEKNKVLTEKLEQLCS